MTDDIPYEDQFDTEDENPTDLSIGTTGMDILRDEIRDENELALIRPTVPKRCSGLDCEKVVTTPTGYCQECEKEYEPILRATMMKCPSCPGRLGCKYSNNELQICIFELREEKRDMKDKESVSNLMRDVISGEKVMYDRCARYVTNSTTENGDFITFSKELTTWSKTLFDHIKSYAQFMGWNKTKMDKEILDAKVDAMKKVLGRKTKKYAYQADKANTEEDLEKKITVPVSVPGHDFENEKPDEFMIPDVDELEAQLLNEDTSIDDDLLILEELEAEFTGDAEAEEQEGEEK